VARLMQLPIKTVLLVWDVLLAGALAGVGVGRVAQPTKTVVERRSTVSVQTQTARVRTVTSTVTSSDTSAAAPDTSGETASSSSSSSANSCLRSGDPHGVGDSPGCTAPIDNTLSPQHAYTDPSGTECSGALMGSNGYCQKP